MLAGCGGSDGKSATLGGGASAAPADGGTSNKKSVDSITAQDIVVRLRGTGFHVTGPTMAADQGYIGQVGGVQWDIKISEAPGDGGINMFPNAEALAAWVRLSKSLGGVAVTRDTWAVSLPTTGDARAKSLAVAPDIAAVLDGTVQK